MFEEIKRGDTVSIRVFDYVTLSKPIISKVVKVSGKKGQFIHTAYDKSVGLHKSWVDKI